MGMLVDRLNVDSCKMLSDAPGPKRWLAGPRERVGRKILKFAIRDVGVLGR